MSVFLERPIYYEPTNYGNELVV